MNRQVKHFIGAVPKSHRPMFDRLQKLIMSLYPEAEVVLSYKIPMFKARSGWVGLGYWKKGVTIYTDGAHNIAGFKANYPEIKTGTGCINFKLTDKIPLADLKKVIRQAVERSG